MISIESPELLESRLPHIMIAIVLALAVLLPACSNENGQDPRPPAVTKPAVDDSETLPPSDAAAPPQDEKPAPNQVRDQETSRSPGSTPQDPATQPPPWAKPDQDASLESLAHNAYQLRMRGHTRKALTALELQAMLARKKNPVDLFELTRIQFHLTSYSRAYHAIEEAVRLDPDNPRYLYWQAVVGYQLNISRYRVAHTLDRTITDQALTALTKALEIDPDFHEARFKLIDMLIRLRPEDGGDVEKALALAATLESRRPGWGLLARGAAIIPGRSWQEILEAAEALLIEDPDDLSALLARAKGLMREKRFDEADQLVRQIVTIDPSRKELLLELALHCNQPESLEKGRAAIQEYLATPSLSPPERAIGLLYMANSYRPTDDKDSYKKFMNMARRIDAEHWKSTNLPPRDMFTPPRAP